LVRILARMLVMFSLLMSSTDTWSYATDVIG
jgi:hypothetical protein